MRLPTLTFEQLDARQKETWSKHAERRDKPVGPYLTWLHSPALMDKVSPLSNYFRFDCNLPVKLREFGLCVVSRFWDAQYSWSAHVDKAIAAGVPAEVMKDIAAGRKPSLKADDERIYYTFAMEILESHFVSEKTFDEARKHFGEKALVDLIGSVGYFSMLSIVLNASETDLNREPPFPDVRGYKKV